ncbi:sigma-70 family RNA polymerase sigma factor [Thauera linaloolentis]|uniref:ECF subfamily RNA polymerase sigma-24 subunit n=1 Tax=Thauera linaloolentis (strain DSM 12138 / JCM 21573 / CCUG 41526 / CIP 105981 / IAM 15112 / NBRC 102519 / 47Lol) TaxID=1123367 RepID=N6XYQ3_THAL4|nr:sigma-70 family RNA polymerase sigma factor [Thauera linaloolentis]ENO86921.1 ECF subfamily RNA polymerase sigma-24 subunit [Thauera linaloolentis 47Lol = DSM 12138]MCM8566664.1 sigma-70 family RNA polymerase sigma factor [Thauera linaloolentis]
MDTYTGTVVDLYRQHHPWLLGWLRTRLGGCPHNAADLAHDTFLRLLGNRRQIENLDQPRAYLTTIARGLVIDHWRRRDIEQAWQQAAALLPEAQAPSPETRALAIEALLRIDAMLEGLRPKVREAFLLAQLDGLGYAEIGTLLGVSERMVKKYMAQAMLACVTTLDGNGLDAA